MMQSLFRHHQGVKSDGLRYTQIFGKAWIAKTKFSKLCFSKMQISN